MKKSKLYVFGDSFSVTHRDNESPSNRVWMNLLADKLNMDLSNLSIWGASQDWVFNSIANVQNDINPEDQIVVVLTDPSRFWYFENNPSISGVHVIDFDTVAGSKDLASAARGYIQYIQRMTLDTHLMNMRLGYLNNLCVVKNLRPAIVIYAFGIVMPDTSNFTKLIFSNGALRHVESNELVPPIQLSGIDVRYNHLGLRNHLVLANKLYDCIIDKTPLDLTRGFHTEYISQKDLESTDFINLELCPWLVDKYNEHNRRS